MILFVDFDGVLRPDWARRGEFHPPCLARFEAMLRDFPDVELVISSDWRWQMRRPTLVALFSPDIGARIVGVTPVMELDDYGVRLREIQHYLKVAAQGRKGQASVTPGVDNLPSWLAIDDRPELFTPEVIGREVLITDPDSAFDAEFEARLREALMARGVPCRSRRRGTDCS